MFELWKQIYNWLIGDSELATLLGATAQNKKIQRGWQALPDDFDKLVTFRGLTEVLDTIPTERHPYMFVCWSKESDKSADDIAERVLKILTGKTLSGNNVVQVLKMEVISKEAPYFDEEQESWRSNVRIAARVIKK